MKKAFDTVDHQILIAKLKAFYFSEHATLWMKSYLSERKQYVSVDEIKSSDLECTVGVPWDPYLNFFLYILTSPVVG